MPGQARRGGWLVGVAALGCAACGFGSAAGRVETPKAGTLVEERCQLRNLEPARCVTLYVPENRGQPHGRVIPLRIVILRPAAPNPAPDPVFFLAGGPGQAATSLLRYDAVASLRGSRDVVLADQRGTGGSNGLSCDFYGPPRDPQSYFDLFLPPAKVRDCRARLESAADLSQYTTASSVDDLEEIRAALGYERINLFGGSYGTRLAQEYIRRHETKVRSVILEGAVPIGKFIPENYGRLAQRALEALLDECAADAACASAFPGIHEKARAVIARLAATPARARVSHPASSRAREVTITREHVAEAIRYMTYSSAEAGRVPLYLHEAYNGNYAPLAQFLLRRRADGTFDGLYLSITCTEDVPFVAADAEGRDESTYLGAYRIREQRAACAEWARGQPPATFGVPLSSQVPALVVSGALDPVTPTEHGAAVAAGFRSHLHVTIPFAGHSPYGLKGLDCLTGLRRTFIERGTLEGIDTSCVSNISRPGFALQLGSS